MPKSEFDPSVLDDNVEAVNQYQAQIDRLKAEGKTVTGIEKAVDGAVSNIKDGATSFVIYGEPQSGKTELMICLTAKLLDDGVPQVIHLLNDSVDLLGQNLKRFKKSKLTPSPVNFSMILDVDLDDENKSAVIFCKKNAKDLDKLVQKLGPDGHRVIVDDEADFATPNSKTNKGDQTPINKLVESLIGSNGTYIGVTATPARLNLNQTLDNATEHWVFFPPHPYYQGKDNFFPIDMDDNLEYRLTLLDGSKTLEEETILALLRFLATVGYINTEVNESEEGYSALIHTSGKKDDHEQDKFLVDDVFHVLSNSSHPEFAKYYKEIWEHAANNLKCDDPNRIVRYVRQNLGRHSVLVLNSKKDNTVTLEDASNPVDPFTVIIGGNIVSRGVTFNNLVSMFFTRNVKTKFQQDTYIQRARMFGTRGELIKFFELTIPEALFEDWHKCFIYHRLSVRAIEEGFGTPVWLGDKRISVAAAQSIKKSNIRIRRQEVSFALFNYTNQIEKVITQGNGEWETAKALQKYVGEPALPAFLLDLVKQIANSTDTISVARKVVSIENYSDGPGIDKAQIERTRGFIGARELRSAANPKAGHHLFVVHNGMGQARIFYRQKGNITFHDEKHTS